nr:predicted GPI-anchored protein 58 [Aegilops tauschii subsp. strangulata]
MTPQPCARDAPSPASARFLLVPCVSVHCGVAAAPHQPRRVRLRLRLAAESPCRALSGSASRAGRVAAAASCAPAPLAGFAARARRLAATASRMSSPRRASQASRSPIPGRPPRDAVSAHSAAAVAGSHSPAPTPAPTRPASQPPALRDSAPSGVPLVASASPGGLPRWLARARTPAAPALLCLAPAAPPLRCRPPEPGRVQPRASARLRGRLPCAPGRRGRLPPRGTASRLRTSAADPLRAGSPRPLCPSVPRLRHSRAGPLSRREPASASGARAQPGAGWAALRRFLPVPDSPRAASSGKPSASPL